MKIPVLRCRIAVSAMAFFALLTVCSAAAFFAHTNQPEALTSAVTTQQVTVQHNKMLASRSALEDESASITKTVTLSASVDRSETTTLHSPLVSSVASTVLEETEETYGYTLDNIAMYQEADPEAEVLCYLSAGTVVTLRSPAGPNWYQVSFEDVVGYVPASQITEDLSEDALYEEPECQSFADTYGTATTNLRLRSIPSRDGDTLGMVVTGQTIQLLTLEDGWYYVEANGQMGYVLEDGVTSGAEKPAWAIERDEAAAVAEAQAARDLVVTRLVENAEAFLGTPYVYGASGTSSFDCSGFTRYLYAQIGYDLPHNAAQQLTTCGTEVGYDDLQAGDLVFFKAGTTRAASHVGMYIGNGEFIHASSGSGCVTISSLEENWYATYYVGARRIF